MGTLQNLTYTRDGRGRITDVASTASTTPPSDVSGESWHYGYDDLDRLTSADNVNNNGLDQTFQYDAVGNMTANSAVGTYSYPAAGTSHPHAVSGIANGPLGGQTFAYDANGSMTCQAGSGPTCSGGDVRGYDGENRLVSATDGTVTTQFVYGPDGARLKKIATNTSPASTTATLYFGDDVEVILGATPQYTKYLPGDAKRAPGAMAGTTDTTWLHRDLLRSVRVITDTGGGVKLRANYHPYGEEDESVSTVAEHKGFIGQRFDDETRLMYLHARYYDPQLGRFLSADPSDPAAAGVGVNRYAYAGNNPIAYLDPTGLLVWGPGTPNVIQPMDPATQTRIVGTVRVVGATATLAAVGAADAASWGAAAPALAAVGALAVDEGMAGLHEAMTGEPTDSFASKTMQSEGVPRDLANGTTAALMAGGSLAAGVRTTAATVTEITSAPGPISRAGVRLYQVDSYGYLQEQSLPYDGISLDHQPSLASQIQRAEQSLGRKLTLSEIKELRKKTTAVAVPDDWHMNSSLTYGGRNTRTQIQMDATDPVSAAVRDSQAMVDGADPANASDAAAAAREVRDRASGSNR